jgi:hypothetical protein
MNLRRNISGAAAVLALALLPASASLAATGNPTVYAVTTLTLRTIDARCFFAPTGGYGWPFSPRTSTHPIRGGFDDPRNPDQAHFGVDVASAVDQQAVYAVRSGAIGSIQRTGGFEDHFWLAGEFGYWHAEFAAGASVAAGQRLGTILPRVNHVHFAEYDATCGYVDPRRPTGALHDPANTERPVIGPLSAFVANAAAYKPFLFRRLPRQVTDTSTKLDLTHLHGVVDFRASVTDTPRHATRRWPQQPLMAAAIQSYLAKPTDASRRFGSYITALDGSRLLTGESAVYSVFAPGTLRHILCFGGGGKCFTRLIIHVAGRGFDTRRMINGPYLWCVRAITINGMPTRSCTSVVIHN